MPIEVYASKFAEQPAERYETEKRLSVAAWLAGVAPSFGARDKHPISVTLNDQMIEPKDWETTEFSPEDLLSICVEPKGSALETIFRPGPLAKLFGIGNPFAQITPTKTKGTKQGDELSLVSAKGNQVSLNDVIPEIAGRRQRYPDYLLPAHRYFGAPREQWLEMLLCVAKGKYDVQSSDIVVGSTPFISLGGDASVTLYQPGDDVSGDTASVWWHGAPEVGSTSTGSAGLDLTATSDAEGTADAQTYIFNGDTVTVPSGAGALPDSWVSGMIVRIEATKPYTVVDGGGSADIITGELSEIGLFAGMLIEITGDNSGLYIVDTYTPGTSSDPDELTLLTEGGAPAIGLITGSVRMCIGYRGLRYRMTAASTTDIAVERLTDTGATDGAWPEWDYYTTAIALIQLDESTTEGGWRGPFMACPENEVTTRLEWDYFFPQGLTRLNEDGQPRDYSVTVEIQYRDAATAGAWSSIIQTYTQRTLDQIGFTEAADLPYAMRPEVRARRVGAKSANPRVYDSVQWYGLRSRLTAPNSYAGVTVMSVRLRGGDRLASQSETLVSLTATRILPIRSGGAWVGEAATRDIVPWVLYLAKSIGYTDDDLDLDEFDRLHDIWSARGDYYDALIDSAGTVKESFKEALQAGFADFTIDRGLIRPVRDEPRTGMEHPYTPQNMTGPLSRQFSALKPDDFDGVDVEYTDGETWQKETVECRIPGDAGLRVEKLQVAGVTDRTRAWRIGMRRRMEQKYRRWSYSFGTELDALNSRYLSYVPLQDDVPGYGQSALMLGYESGVIRSSEPLDWSAGGTHVVGIRRPDGTLSGPYVATRIDDYQLSITGLDFEPDTSWSIEPPHLLFGPLNRWSYPALITAINPVGTEGCSVEAVNYAPEVYTYDDSSPT